jgi:uncharacterized protein with HEPN domain
VHAYFGVDRDVLWEVVERELPKLREDIVAILGASKEPDQ